VDQKQRGAAAWRLLARVFSVFEVEAGHDLCQFGDRIVYLRISPGGEQPPVAGYLNRCRDSVCPFGHPEVPAGMAAKNDVVCFLKILITLLRERGRSTRLLGPTRLGQSTTRQGLVLRLPLELTSEMGLGVFLETTRQLSGAARPGCKARRLPPGCHLDIPRWLYRSGCESTSEGARSYDPPHRPY